MIGVDIMLNKKGLTLVELMAVIAILGILSGFAIMAVTGYKQKTVNKVYTNFEKQLKEGAINYLTTNTDKIPNEKDYYTIYANELLDNNYLDELVDPVENSKKCTNSEETKDSYIKVFNNQDIKNDTQEMQINEDENGNMTINTSNISNLDLKYTICLKCSKYQSKGCSN